MAIYHCNISNVSRAKGSTSCATLSYITGQKVKDERLDTTFDYVSEKGYYNLYRKACQGS